MKNQLRIISGELTKAHTTDAGYDIRTNESTTILAGKSKCLKTGLKIKLPSNTTGFVKSRSGLMFKHGIVAGEGVIDEDYTSEIGVKLFNFSEDAYTVTKGERVAQLVILPIFTGASVEVEAVEISKGSRGSKGFGSSGR